MREYGNQEKSRGKSRVDSVMNRCGKFEYDELVNGEDAEE